MDIMLIIVTGREITALDQSKVLIGISSIILPKMIAATINVMLFSELFS
ncbi:hypothetical protein [Prevotella bivia]|nr:hypothetical protein [Prevotella bivia]MDZ3818375.1 hypothetical protein [Prevotella bivia]